MYFALLRDQIYVCTTMLLLLIHFLWQEITIHHLNYTYWFLVFLFIYLYFIIIFFFFLGGDYIHKQAYMYIK